MMTLISFWISLNLWAGSILIVSDEPGMLKAKEVAQAFATTPPFSMLEDFEVDLQEVKARDLSCLLEKDSVILCQLSASEEQKVLSRRADQLPDSILVVKVENSYRGTAYLNGLYGSITHVTAALAGVHEILHTLGFNDEYTYRWEMAQKICRGVISTPNVFGRTPFYEPVTENLAWNVYWQFIPWRMQILSGTPLTLDGKLRTPNPQQVGLHPSALCSRIQNGFQAWQPLPDVTLMQTLSTHHIPRMYWPLIARKLRSKLRISP